MCVRTLDPTNTCTCEHLILRTHVRTNVCTHERMYARTYVRRGGRALAGAVCIIRKFAQKILVCIWATDHGRCFYFICQTPEKFTPYYIAAPTYCIFLKLYVDRLYIILYNIYIRKRKGDKMKKFYYVRLLHSTVEKDFSSVAEAQRYAQQAQLTGYKLEPREAWNKLGRLSRV